MNKFHEICLRSGIDEKNTQVLFFLCRAVSNSSEKPEDILSSELNSAKNVNEIIDSLTSAQFNKIKEITASDKKTIAIYHTVSAYRDCFGNLASKLRAKGFNVLIMVDILYGDYLDFGYEDDSFVFYGGCGIIKELDFVDAIFAIDLYKTGEKLPKSPHKIALSHGLDWADLNQPVDPNYIYKVCGYNALYYDYYIYAYNFKIMDSLLFEDVYPEELINHNSSHMRLIPGGYPKIDGLIKFFENNDKTNKILLYAPGTKVNKNWDYIKYSEKLIEKLLVEFQDYKVIFRPHPSDRYNDEVFKLSESFNSNPRYSFDLSPSFYETYSKSTLMISDLGSRSCFEFKFSTFKNVIFFTPDEQNEGSSGISSKKNIIGFEVRSLGELCPTIKHLLNDPNGDIEDAKKLGRSIIANLGSCDEYIADNIDCILEGGENHEWGKLKLYSENAISCESPEEYIEQANKILNVCIPYHARVLLDIALKKYPENSRLWLFNAKVNKLFGDKSNAIMSLYKAIDSDINKMPESEKIELRNEIDELIDAFSARDFFDHFNTKAIFNPFVSAYIKEKFFYLSANCDRIALFPGGTHTHWITGLIKKLMPVEKLIIFDDIVEDEISINGYQCFATTKINELKFDKVFLSTDSDSKTLKSRAITLFGDKVTEIYSGLPQGPYVK